MALKFGGSTSQTHMPAMGPYSESMLPDPFNCHLPVKLLTQCSVRIVQESQGRIEFSGTCQLLVCVDGLNVMGENEVVSIYKESLLDSSKENIYSVTRTGGKIVI
jgi:hypothetical protein